MVRRYVCVALAIIGCGHTARRPTDAADSKGNQTILAKLQGYIDCIDEHAARVFQISDLFAERGNMPGFRLPASRDPTKCLAAIEQARKLEPHPTSVEAPAASFATALKAVYALTSAARKDDLAVSEELRVKLVAAFADFDAAEGALFDQVYQLNRAVHADQLAQRAKKSGHTLAIITETMVISAEDLVRFGATPSDQLDKLDLPAITSSLSIFEASFDELATYARAHPEEIEEKLSRYSDLAVEAQALLVAARELIGRARNHVAYSDADKIVIAADNAAAVPGNPAALIKPYNRLVDLFALK